MSRVLCVLPARLDSQRLPRKPLRRIAGRPLIRWSWEAARRVSAFDEIRVATDAPEVARAVRAFGGRAVLTDPQHPSGTDRVAEAAAGAGAAEDDVVVNFQADEPFLDREGVERAVRAVRDGDAPVATLAEPLDSRARWRSPNVVKVVRDADGRALYFSRAPIPHPREGAPDGPASVAGPAEPVGSEGTESGRAVFLRHVGLYVFRRPALRRWTELPTSPLERAERLEQLRALEAGIPIRVVVGSGGAPGVDTPEDLERAARRLEAANLRPGQGDGS